MDAAVRLEKTGKALVEADHRAHQLFEPYKDSMPVRLLDWLSPLGDQPQLRFLAGALIFGGLVAGRARLARAGARMLFAHEAATFVKDRVKLQIDRTRPRSAGSKHEKKPRKGKHKAKELTSFPSGHSAGAIAVARAFSREFPEYRAPAIGAAGAVAATQIPRQAHYPTDVAAGLALGLVAEAAVNGLWSLTERASARTCKPRRAAADPR